MTRPVRVLFLSDTHLGFDLPERPRVERRRRGDDFFANYHRALLPAWRGEVDVVVHGGDVLFRSRVPPGLVRRAFEPLLAIAEAGTPVCVVPGNHERSAIPHALLVAHRRVHVFHRPRTVLLETPIGALALSGFPYAHDVRSAFPALVEATGWREAPAAARLLCMHHAVEGARVGPADFTFTTASDVVRGSDLLPQFSAVLTGHIHRAQVLTRDLRGRPLASPVLYPGSIERTSFAERDEQKGYLLLDVPASPGRVAWRFVELPARPMIDVELELDAPSPAHAAESLRRRLDALPRDSVVRVRPVGRPSPGLAPLLGDAFLRSLAPATMNVAFHRGARDAGD